jgi:hypothetical protein
MNRDTLATHPSESGTHIDAAAITMPSSYRSTVVRLRANKFKTISAVQERSTTPDHRPDEGEKGDLVCQNGATTFFAIGHHVCGVLLNRNADQGFREKETGYRWTTRHEDKVRLHSRGGDSGTSVFTRSNGIAVGELTGGSGQSMWFQEIGYATNALGNPTVLTGTPRKSAPAAATYPATNVSIGGARLNGVVNPHGLTTSYHFQVGKTTSYDITTANRTAGSDRTDHRVSFDQTGLDPATTYHFRIVADNQIGVRMGKDMTFTTAP